MSGYLIPNALPCKTIRALDAAAIQECRIPGLLLMENAGEGCVRQIEMLATEDPSRIVPPFKIVSGFGNNAGDGFVIARHLANRGYAVNIHLTAARSRIRLSSDAGINFEIAVAMGIPIFEPDGEVKTEISRATSGGGTIVDAIFGSGLSRPVTSPQREWIEHINASGLPVLAIDIPSGLDADSGEALGAAVRAAHTFTFVAPKLGFERAAGPQCAGRVHVVGISIPRQLLESALTNE